MKYTKENLKKKSTKELIEIILQLQKNKIRIVTNQPPYTIADGTKGMQRG